MTGNFLCGQDSYRNISGDKALQIIQENPYK